MKITQTNQTFQHRKVPRYIYHLTNQRAYNSMLADGAVLPSVKDPYNLHQGVHTIEFSNFCKLWGHNKIWGEWETLQEALLRQAARWTKSALEGKDKLVILKIPTDRLNPDKLKIRSQNRFFKCRLSNTYESLNPSEHLCCETPATEARRYKNRKEALEYVYQDKIPIQLVEPVGNIIDVPALRKSPDFDRTNPAIEILRHALEGTPESKALKLL